MFGFICRLLGGVSVLYAEDAAEQRGADLSPCRVTAGSYLDSGASVYACGAWASPGRVRLGRRPCTRLADAELAQDVGDVTAVRGLINSSAPIWALAAGQRSPQHVQLTTGQVVAPRNHSSRVLGTPAGPEGDAGPLCQCVGKSVPAAVRGPRRRPRPPVVRRQLPRRAAWRPVAPGLAATRRIRRGCGQPRLSEALAAVAQATRSLTPSSRVSLGIPVGAVGRNGSIRMDGR